MGTWIDNSISCLLRRKFHYQVFLSLIGGGKLKGHIAFLIVKNKFFPKKLP